MTPDELDELDLCMVKDVLGWAEAETDQLDKEGLYAFEKDDIVIHDGGDFIRRFKPSTRAADAFAVLKKCVEKIGGTRFDILMHFADGDKFIVTLNSVHDCDDSAVIASCESAETLELAICLFAKKLFSHE